MITLVALPVVGHGAGEQCAAQFDSDSVSSEEQVKIASLYQAVGLAVNKFLRTGNPMWTEFMPKGDSMGDYIKTLDQMISDTPIVQDTVIYRGETYADKSAIPILGQTILRKNYVSTTDDLTVAERFAKGTVNIVFRIHLRQGQNLLSLSPLLSDKREREFLLPRDTEFTVLNMQEGPSYWLIDVNVL